MCSCSGEAGLAEDISRRPPSGAQQGQLIETVWQDISHLNVAT